MTDAGDGVELRTGELCVGLDGAGRLAISRAADRHELVRDMADDAIGWDLGAPLCRWRQSMPEGRRYFGFGERTGLLDKRGRSYTCWTTDEWRQQGPSTDALYVAVPFYLALDDDGTAFGIYLDTTYRSRFDLTAIDEGVAVMEAESDEIGWYLVNGPDPVAVVERFTWLVGRPRLPPRWALGYHQARWSYADDAEVRDVARRLRENRMPADAVHLDIDHMDGYRVFTWDPSRFPDPRGLVGDLRQAGLRTTVVVDAAVKVDHAYPLYREGHERGYFVKRSTDPDAEELTGYVWPGESVFPDHTRPVVRDWWGGRYRVYDEAGVAGYLNDMNEPAMHDRPLDDPATQNSEPPADTPFGERGEVATHAEVRNAYAVLENRATAEAFAAAHPDRRLFLLTRAGGTGVQRDAVVWTGDNASYWEHLEMSLPQLLNLGLSGISIAGADIGGFFADCSPELLVRWMQLGALYPFARGNSAKGTARQEPWAWGEPTTSRCRRALEVRYRLLPYLYTLAHEATERGLPLLRPLFLHHPDDHAAAAVEDEALVGRDLLIAPVLRPGKTARDVRLPVGGWCDLRTSTWVDGPGNILAPAGLDDGLPIYGRAGAVVPMGPQLASSDERPLDPLTLHVFPDAAGSAAGRLYEDDGESMAYATGDQAVTTFRVEPAGDASLVVAAHRDGAYRPPPRRVEVVVHARDGDRVVSAEDGASWEIAVDVTRR